MKKCEVVAIIPARWGSSRLPGKPLKLIAGVPMIQRVYERTAQCGEVSRVIVATDDQRVIDCVDGFGGQAILSEGDFATGSDRIAGVARQLDLADDTLILNVQGDQPLVNSQSLSDLVRSFTSSDAQDNEMATLGFTMPYEQAQDSGVVKVVLDNNNYALYFSRNSIPYGRDEQLEMLLTHLGVYIYSCRFVKLFKQLSQGYLEDLEKLEQLRLLEHGYKIKVVMSEHNSPEIDTAADIQKIEALIQQRES